MRRPTAWHGLVLAALAVNACQLLTRTDELEVTTSTGAGGGGASSASKSTSVSGGGGSDGGVCLGGVGGGGVGDGGAMPCLHCNLSFTMGIHTDDPSLCPTSHELLKALRCCACNVNACGGMAGKECQMLPPNEDWCDNYPASSGCMACLMATCPNTLCACLADK